MNDINNKNICNSNKSIINNIIIYILKSFNITDKELISNTKIYIKRLLKDIRDNNNKVRRLRLRRQQIRDDIHDIEVSMVTAQSFEEVVVGFNNGEKKNTTEIRYLQKQELRQDLYKLVIETELLEKSLNDNNKLIEDFINILPNGNQKTIMCMTYIECLTNSEIANVLLYNVQTIDNERYRGLNEMVSILNYFLKNREFN